MLNGIFSNPGFMPHIHCYLDRPAIVWTMLFTDLLIGLSYAAISLTLLTLIRKSKIPFSFVILCFGLFIGACGATHFMEIWTLWHPDYWWAASIKLVTSIASVGTGLYLFKLRHTILKVVESANLSTQDRKRIEREFREILERTSDGFFTVDSEWRVDYANPVTRGFFALLNRGEIIGQSMSDLFPSPDRPKFMAHYERIAQTGDSERFQETYEGRVLQVHAYQRSEGGVAIFYRDTTEQEEASEMLRQSEERFRQLSESLTDQVVHIMELNPHRISYVSPSYEKIWRQSVNSLYSNPHSFIDRIHPDDRAHVRTSMERQDRGEIVKMEYRLLFENGEIKWIKDSAFPVKNSQGVLYRATGIAEDITEVRLAEQKLRESEAKFRTIADAMPQMVWSTLPDGNYDYFNRQWYAFTGVPKGSTHGEGWNALLHPDDQKRAREVWSKSLKSGEDYEMEYRVKHHTGEYRWTLGRALPVRDSEGNIIRWMGTSTDINDQKINQSQLEEALRARDEFLSIASHELQTPLTSLKLQTQLMQRSIKKGDSSIYTKPKVDQLTEQTDKQIGRLVRLVDDMLDIARIRAGHLSLERSRVDLTDLVKSCIERMTPQFMAGKSSLPELTVRGGPYIGHWDAVRIEQVMNNLFTNAIRYGRGNPIRISISGEVGIARVTVKDEGIGIALEAQDKIFDRFERAVDANEVSGLGLGLFITRKIVNAHQGKISVKSTLGEGASFTVELPMEPTTQSEMS